jgi:predicted transcriptional regulator
MDDRTARLLEALDPVSVSLLLELLGKPATEHELLESAEASQSTANRRLDRLRRARLIAQEPGKRRAPGRLWTVVHPEETEVLLTALFALADAIEALDQSRREEAKRQLKRARAERLGIRPVDNRDVG